jgi:DNA helicase II / ATP-dependent DNA helicase PcrA
MSELNPEQKQAVEHIEGPLLVLAGAGSGKTRVVTHRIAHLLDSGVPSEAILAVTFTNKAAEEMRHRIRMLKNRQILACTFHSLGARILRESIAELGYKSDFLIYDEEDSEKLLKKCMGTSDVGAVRQQISWAKNNLLEPDMAIAEFYTAYQQKLKECNALDFDDLLYLTVRLLQQSESARTLYQTRWQFVLIDEYQDTNLAQYTIAKILVEKHNNIFAVGDPDQSIYSWRGARYQNILNFERDFPGAKVITLDQNYRSTNTILQAANALIQHNGERYEKRLWSALGDGEKITLCVSASEREEARFVARQIVRNMHTFSLDEIAIFYRTNAQSRAFEDALLEQRIDYRIIGGLSFYQRREVKDVLAFLKMLISDTDLISFLRTINLPKRGLGATTLEKLVEAAGSQPIFSFCEEAVHHMKFSAKQRAGLEEYVSAVRKLRAKQKEMPLHQLISEALHEFRYLDHLKEDPESFQDRKENVEELMGKAAEWEETGGGLGSFLEELSLRTSLEEKDHIPTVKLMTLHNSKGLEFNLVFLVGMEEDLFPHINSRDDEAAIEEERRLCYVGMTRAKRKLFLCTAAMRYMWGVPRYMRPSRFLKEVPLQFLVKNQT